MGKWRPSDECIYVIPDIHGQYNQLELILSRILPLRRTGGVKDIIVFLGDYIDRGSDSPKVVDKIISLKEKYRDQVVALRGNHEDMIINALQPSKNSDEYLYWMRNGGVQTVMSYANTMEPYSLLRERVRDFIPKSHLDFFDTLPHYFEKDNFVFVHGGCNPMDYLGEQDPQDLIWDRSFYKYVSNLEAKDLHWDKCIVVGHSGNKMGKVLILPKFMMLDCSPANQLLVFEVNSFKGFVAKRGKKKLVKLNF